MTPALRIKDLPPSERPRERLTAQGAENLGNADLIAIILRSGMRGLSAVAAAEQLLARYQSLDRLARASLDELRAFPGIGPDKAVTSRPPSRWPNA